MEDGGSAPPADSGCGRAWLGYIEVEEVDTVPSLFDDDGNGTVPSKEERGGAGRTEARQGYWYIEVEG